MKLRILGIAAKWLFMLCLPVLLLTASLGWAADSLWLYKYGSQEYNVSQTLADAGLELTGSELEEVYAGLISYFNSGEEYISLTVMKDGEPFELFNQREIIHLKDVKGLIWLDYWVLLGTLVYVLAYAGVCLFWRKKRYWRRLAWGVVGGGGITLAFMLALGLGILLGFSQLFWQFHVVFFPNEFWLLDPTKDYLKMLFPDGFFYDAALFCALGSAGLAVILGGVSGGYLIFSRRKVT
ncbi:MAG: TIGR01906 family membrane protein [Dehalococcoidales bacterium]|nr:TIGR01906 family membrane protein [Dehalococcoidales bacterium]